MNLWPSEYLASVILNFSYFRNDRHNGLYLYFVYYGLGLLNGLERYVGVPVIYHVTSVS